MPAGARLVVLLFGALGLLVLGPGTGVAESPNAGVVIAVQGQSTLTRTALPRPILLKFKDDVFVRDRIDTQENSVARILLGGKVLVTVRELSVFTITEEAGRAVGLPPPSLPGSGPSSPSVDSPAPLPSPTSSGVSGGGSTGGGTQPPPSGSAFTPPGQGGAAPNTRGNVTPGHGGTPPGQRNK